MTSTKYGEKPFSHEGIRLHKNTQILYGAEKAVGKGVKFMENTRSRMDITFDHRAPSIVIKIPEYYNGYQDILKRGGTIRCITIITKENLSYCEELIKIVSELRHLDDLKGGIAVNESEYMATTVLQEAQPLTEVIYSNVDEIVEQNQFIFDTLWKNAVPAQVKIRELKEGLKTYETKLIPGTNGSEATEKIPEILQNASELNLCTSIEGLQDSKDHIINSMINLFKEKKLSSLNRIRVLTPINQNNLRTIKNLIKLGIEIKHSNDILSINYVVTNSDLVILVKGTEAEYRSQNDSLLYSNDPSYIDHFSKVFDDMWKNGKNSERIIQSLENEIELSFIQTIEDPEATLDLVRTLISSAKNEILGLLPNFKSFIRQIDDGMIELIRSVAQSNQNLDIRILITEEINDEMQKQIIEIFNRYNSSSSTPEDSDDLKLQFQFENIDNFRLKLLNSKLHTEIGFLIIDREKSLLIESKNISSDSTLRSIGLSSFSNSKRISNSYASIFEAIWNQSELYDKLRIQDRLQKEFINIAAHELRNPVQSLLGYSDILMNSKGNIESWNSFIVTINQSTKRLAKLIDKVLDVTQLENELLILNKDVFDFENLVKEIVREYNNTIRFLNKDQLEIALSIKNKLGDESNGVNTRSKLVYADRVRIVQVIMNILENAVEFTKTGRILIDITTDDKSNEIYLSISDSGGGIDPKILPKLFTKFVSKSKKGTGLGLYICKKIIEAHNGKIWAENYYSDPSKQKVVGSKFTISLPCKDNSRYLHTP